MIITVADLLADAPALANRLAAEHVELAVDAMGSGGSADSHGGH